MKKIGIYVGTILSIIGLVWIILPVYVIATTIALSLFTSTLILGSIIYSDLKCYSVNVYSLFKLIISNSILLYFIAPFPIFIVNIVFFLLYSIIFIAEHFNLLHGNWEIGGKLGLVDIYLYPLWIYMLLFAGNVYICIFGFILFLILLGFVKLFTMHKDKKETIIKSLSYMDNETLTEIENESDYSNKKDLYYNALYYNTPLTGFYKKGNKTTDDKRLKKISKTLKLKKGEKGVLPMFPIMGGSIVILSIINLIYVLFLK